ncbi:MAG: bifunctional riboflavin kinase/FAD synthetase [Vicinamibacterales bacterium]|nr:bifunctional riboflavin kinase/FAD synthetase [Vicinamibacterales bacterium]
MEVAHFPDDPRPVRWHHTVLALGNFDGLHRGHVKIIERVRRGAGERGGTPVVLTFDPHPPRVVRPDKAPPLLMTQAQKIEALERAGIQGVAVVRFTLDLSRWEPEAFVRAVLVDWLRVAEVWVGADFLFGRDRSGNFSLLRTLGAQYGFRVEKIDPVRYKDFVVSSTRIRRLVGDGRMDEAGALLGHHYAIDGVVVAGAGRGRGIGFPTANLATDNELLPPHGVYATTATLDGVIHPAVTNIGVRPTFGTTGPPTIETHILGWDEDVYGRPLRLSFVQRLREERAFPDVDALKAQIDADVRRATRLFDRLSV